MARPSPRRNQPSIHPLVPALIAVVVFGVLVLVVANLGDGGSSSPAAPVTSSTGSTAPTLPPETTTTTTTLPEPVDPAPLLAAPPVEDTPTTYRIDYDVVENGLARTERITVRRPYESLQLSERDGALLSGSATSRTKLRTYLSDRDGWLTLQPELHRAAFDARPLRAVAALEVLGFVEEVGTDEIAGRTCTVYRTGEPPESSTVSAPSDAESTDLCIDASGLVLHQRWLIDGNTVTERTATAVEVGITVDPAIFDPTPPVQDEEDFAAAFTSIAVPADEETLARLETVVPEGGPLAAYTADGAVFRAGTPSQGMPASSEIVRFYSSGPELLEVSEQYADRPVFLGGDSAAVRIDVEGWDEVWLVPGFRNSAVRARLDDYSYVELRHADIGFLLDVVESLERVEG